MAGNPQLHVLIAGVSAYPYLPEPNSLAAAGALGLRQLTSPALSAFSLYRWLQQNQADLPLPLGSCQLLLCPSKVELAADAALATAYGTGISQACTLTSFLTAAELWRQNAATDRGNITWFYFAGHGVQRSKNDAVLLLEDFGQPPLAGVLRNAIDLNTLFNGMAPSDSQPEISRTQFYFIDACRVPADEFKKVETQNTTQVFEVELGGEDDRQAPIFFATISGGAAAGFIGKTSVFCNILLQCLEGSAGEPLDDAAGGAGWNVTSFSAAKAMTLLFDDYNDAGLGQKFAMSGLTQGNPQLRRLRTAPKVDVFIDVDPQLARGVTNFQVMDLASLWPMQLPTVPPGPPYQVQWTAGAYRFQIQVPAQPPYINPLPYVQTLLPPRCRIVRRVVP